MPALAPVAILAFFTVCSPVSIVLAMTGVTTADPVPGFISGLVLDRMTGIAGLVQVQALQPEPGIAIVIEVGIPPRFFAVTALAPDAETIVVNVAYLVATDASLRRVLEFFLDMACVTVDLAMGEPELEAGLVVIELGFAPARLLVAIHALFAQLAVVRVILGVAGVTGLPGIAVFLAALMTGATFGQRVFAPEQKIGLPMIEGILVEPDDL